MSASMRNDPGVNTLNRLGPINQSVIYFYHPMVLKKMPTSAQQDMCVLSLFKLYKSKTNVHPHMPCSQL